ncbi:TonB-dependent receptor [Maricurvus nonylphenolicus]|uniref:TonB-dependent receptor n=1 Tax=Maricurvus nonylphenolicus TaxID=1008307 RepID=UPI0036F3DE65
MNNNKFSIEGCVKTGKCLLALSVAAVGSAVPSMVNAETDDSLLLEEVIVTAQKRQQSLQDVPVSVSAVSGETIADAGIADLQNLSSYVPNLKINQGPTESGIYIRGLGSGNERGFEQSVGLFIDGVYAGKARQFQAPFLDVDAVEVLRGPQGTLFGKNTVAGSITINTVRPTDELEASYAAEYEVEYGSLSHQAIVSGPLTDTLSGRLALKYAESDGYMENSFQDRDEVGSKTAVGRMSLLWRPTEDTDVFFKYETADTNTKGKNFSFTEVSDAQLATYKAIDPDFKVDDYHRSTSADEYADVDSNSYTLQVDHGFKNHDLTWIASYSEFETTDMLDMDFSPVDIGVNQLDQDFEQVSHELRLTSQLGGDVEYIAGLYYQANEYDTRRQLGLNAGPLGHLGASSDFSQTTDTYSAYGSLTWHQTEALAWTLGLRYSKEEKEGERQVLFTDYLSSTPLDEILSGGLYAAAVGVNQSRGYYEHEIDGDISAENLSPSLKLQYDVNDDLMVYASYSKAFKSGGFSESGTQGDDVGEYDVVPSDFDYDEEEAVAYEVGGKATLWGGRATLNFAVFRTEYEDLQVSSYSEAAGVFVVGNAASSVSQGIELDGVVRLTEALRLTSSLSYLDATYGSFEDATPTKEQSDNGALVQDLSGEVLPQAPKWTWNLGLDHEVALGNNLELHSHVDLNYTDDHYIADDLDPRSEEDAYTVVNARVALRNPESGWELALLGKNLTDEHIRNYFTNGGLSDGVALSNLSAPRTVALQFRISY